MVISQAHITHIYTEFLAPDKQISFIKRFIETTKFVDFSQFPLQMIKADSWNNYVKTFLVAAFNWNTNLAWDSQMKFD